MVSIIAEPWRELSLRSRRDNQLRCLPVCWSVLTTTTLEADLTDLQPECMNDLTIWNITHDISKIILKRRSCPIHQMNLDILNILYIFYCIFPTYMYPMLYLFRLRTVPEVMFPLRLSQVTRTLLTSSSRFDIYPQDISNHSCLRDLLEVLFWTCDTFDNNLEIRLFLQNI